MYDRTTLDTLNYHFSMLGDEVRTSAYLRAIMHAVRPGDIVLDIGSGTGILALFACVAGAEHVYAVEQGPIIGMAQEIAAQNGFEDRITFIADWSTAIELPTKVDVIVTETIGNAGFDEGLLGWMKDAQQRLLAEDGRFIPQQVEMVAVPVQSEDDYYQIEGWRWPFYSLDYRLAGQLAANSLHWTELEPKGFLSTPEAMVGVDLNKLDGVDVTGQTTFEVNRDGTVHGLGIWFNAELFAGIRISNAPPNSAPNWDHGFLPLEEPLSVVKGDRLAVSISTSANAGHWHWHVSKCSGREPETVTEVSSAAVIQQTTAGTFPNGPGDEFLSWTPSLHSDADVDLFILTAMDGVTPVAEIIRRIGARFPNRFPDEKEISSRIQELCIYYSLTRRNTNA